MNAYCINIDSDVESWQLSKAEFQKIGMEVQRFSAIVEDNRPLAFNKSVHAALSLMPEGGWLFEDDVMFEGEDLRETITKAIGRLPSDFMTFHLGCNFIGTDTIIWQMPTAHSKEVAKLWNCFQSHATFYSKEAVEFITKNLNTEYLDEHNNIFDDWLRRNVLSQGRSYVINPMVCYQRPRESAIWGGMQDYTGCHKQGNLWLKNNL